MTDEHEQDPPLDPEDEARIRALLADLGSAPGTTGETAMPPEVAARLDETVARLVAERASSTEEIPEEVSSQEHATVVPLRRRWATRAAGAAAAVIVVGAGGVAVANLGGFGGTATQDNSAGGSSTSGQAESLDRSATPPAHPSASQGGDLASGQVPKLTSASFDTAVARLLGPPVDAAAGQPKSSQREPVAQDGSTDALRATACPGPDVTDGSQRIPVTYDGQPAVLLVHPPRGGDQLVEAWSCSGAKVLDSASVVAPTSGQSPGNPGLGSPTPTP